MKGDLVRWTGLGKVLERSHSFYKILEASFPIARPLRIDYGDDGAIHALVHSNLDSSALDYPN